MGSKLFPKDKVKAEDWVMWTAKREEALAGIAEARKNKVIYNNKKRLMRQISSKYAPKG